MDSDKDDEQPHNERGTSSNSQTTVPVHYLFNKEQQVDKVQHPVCKDQLQVLILVMKTVGKETSVVHRQY